MHESKGNASFWISLFDSLIGCLDFRRVLNRPTLIFGLVGVHAAGIVPSRVGFYDRLSVLSFFFCVCSAGSARIIKNICTRFRNYHDESA